MKIHYRKKKNEIEIIRCFSPNPRVVIPARIEELPVTSLAPYAFSDHLDGEPQDILVWEDEPSFRNGSLSGNSGFPSGSENMAAVSGERLEELLLPDTLKETGRYIFYGCSSLKRLEFSDDLMQIGTGAFTGCHALDKIIIHLKHGDKTCVREILEELWQRVDVTFSYEQNEAYQARLVFPEHYDEAVENTPARILYTEYHGSGSNYRQCFYDRKVNFADYDRLFPMAAAMERTDVLTDMIFNRLEYPVELYPKARAVYEEYLKKNLTEIIVLLVKTGNLHRMEFLSEKKLWTKDGIDAGLLAAAGVKSAEIAAFFMEESEKSGFTQREPAKKKRFQL